MADHDSQVHATAGLHQALFLKCFCDNTGNIFPRQMLCRRNTCHSTSTVHRAKIWPLAREVFHVGDMVLSPQAFAVLGVCLRPRMQQECHNPNLKKP